ncbi:hypothetical protein [Enterococcus innesii]|uniref:hypothetical protein n=1 Tax=Enterococcus innesii TaxID=2839759 RepID=UPI003D0CA63F
MDNEKAILITVKIGENEMKGFVSEISDKEASDEESLEFYNSTFEGYEQRLALIASRVYTKWEKTFEKEEIHTIAEILKVLATAPSFSEAQTGKNSNYYWNLDREICNQLVEEINLALGSKVELKKDF